MIQVVNVNYQNWFSLSIFVPEICFGHSRDLLGQIWLSFRHLFKMFDIGGYKNLDTYLSIWKTSQVFQFIYKRYLLVCLHDFGKFNINHINVILLVYFQINLVYVSLFTETCKWTESSYKRLHIHSVTNFMKHWWVKPKTSLKCHTIFN